MKPSIGRIVHYVHNTVHFAAIVTRVWTDTCVNLQVFNNGDSNGYEEVFIKTSVVIDPKGEADYSWHWPENVQTVGEVKN